jgi:hypothetical protein
MNWEQKCRVKNVRNFFPCLPFVHSLKELQIKSENAISEWNEKNIFLIFLRDLNGHPGM